MVLNKIDALKAQIRDVLSSDDFQRIATGLSGTTLSAAVAGVFKRRGIRVTLISVAPAEKASLADFAAVWKSSLGDTPYTNWFSLKQR
jgi:hypothetical protein